MNNGSYEFFAGSIANNCPFFNLNPEKSTFCSSSSYVRPVVVMSLDFEPVVE